MALRAVLSIILGCQIAFTAFAADSMAMGFFNSNYAAVPKYGANFAVFVLSPLLWLLYVTVPLGKIHRSFRSTDDDAEALAGDTDGVAYKDVVHIKGYEMAPYICPRITERVYEATKRARRSMAITAAPSMGALKGTVDFSAAAAATFTAVEPVAPPA